MGQFQAVSTGLRVAYTIEECWHRVPGGTAVAALETARALVRRAEVEVIGVAARHGSPPAAAWTPPLEVRQLPLPRQILYECWHRLRRPRVDRATGTVNVIHATAMPMPPRSAPVVITMHDLAFLQHPTHFTTRGVRFFRRGLALAIDEADLALCPSETTRRRCEAAGFEHGKLRVVPLGVHADVASEEDVERVTKHHGITRPYILWAGTIEPRKNLRNLLEAFALQDSALDLVLVGPSGWNEDVDSLVDPVRERVKVLGFVSREDLGPLYAGARVFCFPSFVEGFGLPVLEAMAQGTPVVTSLGTATEELARDAGVLIDPTDPRSIADGIDSVVEDESLAGRLSDAGKARASQYSWDRTAELVTRAYREVAA
jgi:glycosyltransferase involved in cell wall biosynthesis